MTTALADDLICEGKSHRWGLLPGPGTYYCQCGARVIDWPEGSKHPLLPTWNILTPERFEAMRAELTHRRSESAHFQAEYEDCRASRDALAEQVEAVRALCQDAVATEPAAEHLPTLYAYEVLNAIGVKP